MAVLAVLVMVGFLPGGTSTNSAPGGRDIRHPTSVGTEPAALASAPGCPSAPRESRLECHTDSIASAGAPPSATASHAPWVGAVVGVYTNVSLPEAPDGIASDPATGRVYLSGNFSGTEGNVTVMSNGTIVTTIPLPGLAAGLTFDPSDGYVYAADLTNATISVIGGLSVVATIPVVQRPQGIAYDPANGYVYVSNESGTNVTVLDGEDVLATVNTGNYTPYGGGWFGGVACDPSSGLVYVTKLAQGAVAVINGTKFVENLALPNGDEPQDIQYDASNGLIYVAAHDGQLVVINGTQLVAATSSTLAANSLVFDPANGLVYVDNYTAPTNGSITAINGTTVLPASFTPGAQCGTMGYDPTTGDILAACGLNELLLISTRLTQSPVTAVPLGDPTDSMDVNQTLLVNATFLADGMDWNLGDSYVRVVPPGGLSCEMANATTVTDSNAMIFGSCVAESAGSYLVQLGAGNTLGYALNSSVRITVYPQLSAGAPSASVWGVGNVSSVDVGQTVTLAADVTGGTGFFLPPVWRGLSVGNCAPDSPLSVTCVFGEPETLELSYAVQDSNLANATSGVPLVLPVYPLPVALGIDSNRTSADVGQRVEFGAGIAPATGSPGAVSIIWTGLPAGCPPTSTELEVCDPEQPEATQVRFTAIDSDSGTSNQSTPLSFQVFSDPAIALLAAGPVMGTVGVPLTLSATTSGGSGGDTFSWLGLPGGCSSTNDSVTCLITMPGIYRVTATVQDSNGFLARSGAVTVDIGSVSSTPPPPPSAAPGWVYGVLGASAGGGAVAAFLLIRRRVAKAATTREGE